MLLAAVLFGALLLGTSPALQSSESDEGWEKLVSLDEVLTSLREPERLNGVPQFGPPAIGKRAETVDRLRQELAALDPSDWSVAGKVDYLLVWAKANGMDFEHRVTRPWERDPIFYLNQIRRVPYSDVPVEGDDEAGFRTSLAAVPATLEQAAGNLTEPIGELADLAIFHLENFDGVGQGQPYRDEPPGGTIAWYEDLCARVDRLQPEETEACASALEAVRSYRDWLRAARPDMPASAGIGTENLEWYFRNVRLLPYGVDDLLLLGEREFHRYRAAWEIVRSRNQNLPELELTQSREQHEQRTEEAEREIRALVEEQGLLTFPEETPDSFETDTFWSPRAATDRHFWEELQFRNTFNNHIHASIPGHRFDGMIARQVANPIRRRYGDSTRAEGWATYLEEMFVLAGLTKDVPRADELFYVALMKRASRIYAETKMHAGEMTLDEANLYMIDYVPFMEEDLGRYDLEGYLRRPGSGSGYIIGKIQLEKLLSERSLALGDEFELGSFHDDLLSRGMIPLMLVRWEMTGSRRRGSAALAPDHRFRPLGRATARPPPGGIRRRLGRFASPHPSPASVGRPPVRSGHSISHARRRDWRSRDAQRIGCRCSSHSRRPTRQGDRWRRGSGH